jgi:nucleoside-diphosphate-sugar epimerase
MKEGLPLVIVQPGVIYGPGDQGPTHDAWVQYLTGKMPLVPRGTEFCWAHVEDVARGHILAMEKGKAGESYILAGPRHSFLEAMGMAQEITGVKPPSFHPGPGLLKGMAGMMKVVGSVIPLPDAYTAESIRVIAGVTYIGDNAKARRELGYAPRPLREGLRETLAWEMEQLGMKPRLRTA